MPTDGFECGDCRLRCGGVDQMRDQAADVRDRVCLRGDVSLSPVFNASSPMTKNRTPKGAPAAARMKLDACCMTTVQDHAGDRAIREVLQ